MEHFIIDGHCCLSQPHPGTARSTLVGSDSIFQSFLSQEGHSVPQTISTAQCLICIGVSTYPWIYLPILYIDLNPAVRVVKTLVEGAPGNIPRDGQLSNKAQMRILLHASALSVG